MKPLTTAQARLLFVLQMGGFINQGNLVLVDSNYICLSYDRRSLRVLINRDLVRVSQDTLRWEARLGNIEEEEDVMIDENYYKTMSDEMGTMLKCMLEHMSPRTHEGINARSVAQDMVLRYERHEATNGKDKFQELARSIGADPDWYGQNVEWPITINGKTIISRYRISGINIDKPVNQIMLTSSRGKVRWTSVVQVMKQMGDAKAPEERKRAIQV